MRSRIPGAPGVPVGGDGGRAGSTLRVVSCGSCARAFSGAKKKAPMIAVASASERLARATSCVEVVVVVSLTHERTVYFTL
jgi:hypothetical protein